MASCKLPTDFSALVLRNSAIQVSTRASITLPLNMIFIGITGRENTFSQKVISFEREDGLKELVVIIKKAKGLDCDSRL